MHKIDWEFIGLLEGKAVSVGYQPTLNSGVTICTGFDLKEKDEPFLRTIGIPEDIINKLKQPLQEVLPVKNYFFRNEP